MKSCYFLSVFCALWEVGFSKSPDWPAICHDLVERDDWGARVPVAIDYALLPVKYVVVHHTVTPECTAKEACSATVRNIQTFHMDEMEFHDIGYNFLVGGDGNIYEGAGWHKVGAHTRGYNSRSLGLAFIGDFMNKKPSPKQLQTAKDFLQCAVELGELDTNYKLFGARQVSATNSPGTQLYSEIQRWKHFSRTP